MTCSVEGTETLVDDGPLKYKRLQVLIPTESSFEVLTAVLRILYCGLGLE
jgi:hypothetical protein